MTRPRWTREPAAMRRALVRPVHVITVPRSTLDVDANAMNRQVQEYGRRFDHFAARGEIRLTLDTTDYSRDVERVTVDARSLFPLRRRRLTRPTP